MCYNRMAFHVGQVLACVVSASEVMVKRHNGVAHDYD